MKHDRQPSLEQLIAEVLGSPEVSGSPALEPVDGTVAITEGIVVVQNPESGGKYPAIEPSSEVRILVNGELISETTIITKEDDIRVEVNNQDPRVEMDIEITNDKLNAFLIVNRQNGRQYKLRDMPPTIRAKVHVDTVAEIPPPRISPQDVMALLESKGIKYGIIESSISRVCENFTEGKSKVLIAAGTAPELSKDAFVEYVFTKKNLDKVAVNPYNNIVNRSVEVGEVLAVKHSAVEGKDGINIFNEVANAKPPQDVTLMVGEGVKLLKNDTLAVAAIAGRPVLDGTGSKRLRVLPVYTVPGDVDVNLGSITFKGDIVVHGSVLEGFRLIAGGDITVFGNVIQAELIAEGNITVHNNLISSVVYAGSLALNFKQLLPDLKKICSIINSILQAMKVLKSHEAFKLNDLAAGEGRLVQLLIDTKFKNLPMIIEEVFEMVRSTKSVMPPELKAILALLPKLTGLNPLRFETEQEVVDLLGVLESSCDEMERNYGSLQPSNVTALYVQNSVVKCSGSITVTGRGAITSELLAIENVSINSDKSVVRGGRISSGGTIQVNELGSNGNVPCVIVMNERSRLEAKIVHPAVTIVSGFGKCKFEDMSRYTKAYISPKGTLEVEKLKA